MLNLIKEEDSERKCFICNIEKFNFEKAGINFEKHKDEEHNIWDYMNFLILMRSKTEKDCTGVEDEIYKKLKKGDMSWLPIKRSSGYGNLNFCLFSFVHHKI